MNTFLPEIDGRSHGDSISMTTITKILAINIIMDLTEACVSVCVWVCLCLNIRGYMCVCACVCMYINNIILCMCFLVYVCACSCVLLLDGFFIFHSRTEVCCHIMSNTK